MLELLNLGQIQLSITGGNWRQQYAPEYDAITVPFVFSTWEEVDAQVVSVPAPEIYLAMQTCWATEVRASCLRGSEPMPHFDPRATTLDREHGYHGHDSHLGSFLSELRPRTR